MIEDILFAFALPTLCYWCGRILFKDIWFGYHKRLVIFSAVMLFVVCLIAIVEDL